jgi:O-antigen ligase
MVVFSPWAFGTTQEWAIGVMNTGGYFLGVLLMFKLLIRRIMRWRPERWGRSQRSFFTCALLVCTSAVLGYCALSGLNWRATFVEETLQFQYREPLAWLPHSYNRAATWNVFWGYLALACDFWAIRDWLLAKAPEELGQDTASRSAVAIPLRLRRLLWVLGINGAVLALEGFSQRALGSSKLLWIVEPRINKSPETQFGPYAYRSNAAQYMLLLWPLILGFWWMLGTARPARWARFRHYLLPCVLVMAMVPLASLSRAGAVIGSAGILAAIFVMLRFGAQQQGALIWGTSALLAIGLLVGAFVDWKLLSPRLEKLPLDSARHEIWQNTWKIAQDFPWFGTGPGTFDAVYFLYRPAQKDPWAAQAHNDWLEFLATFGIGGCALLAFGLGLVLVSPLLEKRVAVPRVFFWLGYLGLVNCLLFATVDFPLQIYSLVFLFVLLCTVLSCVSRRRHA